MWITTINVYIFSGTIPNYPIKKKSADKLGGRVSIFNDQRSYISDCTITFNSFLEIQNKDKIKNKKFLFSRDKNPNPGAGADQGQATVVQEEQPVAKSVTLPTTLPEPLISPIMVTQASGRLLVINVLLNFDQHNCSKEQCKLWHHNHHSRMAPDTTATTTTTTTSTTGIYRTTTKPQ